MYKVNRIVSLILAYIMVLVNIPLEVYAEVIQKNIAPPVEGATIVTTLNVLEGQEDIEIAEDKSIVMSTEDKVDMTLGITPKGIYTGQLGGIELKIEVPKVIIEDGDYKVVYDIPSTDPRVIGGVELDIVGGNEWPEATKTKVRDTVKISRSAGLRAGVTSSIKVTGKLYQKEGYELPEQIRMEVLTSSYADTYTDEDGKVITISYKEQPHDGSRQVLINSNLKYRAKIEGVTPYPVVYKRYNYLEFQVEIENYSTVPEPYFDEHEFLFDIPHLDEEAIGIEDRQISKWAYDEKTGAIKEMTEEEIKKNPKGMFIGKKEKGGLLIYDVTKYNLKPTDELPKDLTDKDSLPYTYTGLGLIGVKIKQDVKNKVESPTLVGGTGVTKKVYRVLIPFPNSMSGEPPFKVKVDMNYTVGYGSPIIRTTKKTEGESSFVREEPVFKFDKEVYGVENGYIGEVNRYVLKNVRNEGIVPVFNPRIEDKLPEGYNLTGVRYRGVQGSLDKYLQKGKEIELEVQNNQGIKMWVGGVKIVEENGEWVADIEGKKASLKEQGLELTGKIRVNYLTEDRESEIIGDGENYRYLDKGERIEGELIIEGELDRENLKKKYRNEGELLVDYKAFVHKTQEYKDVVKTYREEATIDIKLPEVYTKVTGYVVNPKDATELEDSKVVGGIDERTSGYYVRIGSLNKSDIYRNEVNIEIPLDQDNKGYIAESVYISPKYVNLLEIESMVLEVSNGGVKELGGEELEVYKDGAGGIRLDKKEWEELGGELKKIHIKLDSIKSEKGVLTNDAYIKIEGYPNKIGNLVLKADIKTKAIEPEFVIEKEGEGEIEVGVMRPVVEVKKYRGGIEIDEEEISYNEKGLKVEYKIGNEGGSTVPGEFVLEIPVKEGEKRGYITDRIRIKKGYERMGEIERIEVYNIGNESYKEGESTGQRRADKVIEGSELNNYKTPEGDINIEGEIGGLIIRYEKIYQKTYEGELKEEDKTKIEIEGGLEGVYGELKFKGELNCLHPTMLHIRKEREISYKVAEPEIQINVHFLPYYNEVEIEEESPNLDNKYERPKDKTIEKLGVPYEKEVTYQYRLSNESISRATNFESEIYLDINPKTMGEEGNRGFHAERIKIKNNIFNIADIESIKLKDIDGDEIVLEKEGEELILKKGGVEGGRYSIKSDIELDVVKKGMNNLHKIEINGGEFKENIAKEVTTELENEKALNAIEVTGYSDSELGAHNESITEVRTKLRKLEGEDIKTNKDIGVLTVSKMYFDTIVNASFKVQGEKDRYTRTTVSEKRDEYREKTRNTGVYYAENRYDDDIKLEIGYKSIGSIGLDFRQYNIDRENAEKEVLVDNKKTTLNEKYKYHDHEVAVERLGVGDVELYPSAGQYNHIRRYAYNTEAEVELELDVPEEGFESYYIKIDPRVRNDLKSVTVIREDGSKEEIGVEEWVDNGVDKEGNKTFWRLNLLGDKVTYETYDNLEDNDKYYKNPINYKPSKNKVDKVIFKIKINEEEVDEKGDAKEVSFGTWYEDIPYQTGKDYFADKEGDDMSYAWNQNMFEVVGRYYKEGDYKAKVETKIEIGGGKRGAKRVEEGNSKNTESEWSYNNRYYYWRPLSYDSYRKYGKFYNAKEVYDEVEVEVVHDNYIRGLKGATEVDKQKDISNPYGFENKYEIDVKKEDKLIKPKYFNSEEYIELRGDDWIYPYEEVGVDNVAGYPVGFERRYHHLDNVVIEDTLPPLKYNEVTKEYEGFKFNELRIKKESLANIDELIIKTTKGKEVTYYKSDFYSKGKGEFEVGIKYPNEQGRGTVNEIELEEGEYVEKILLKAEGIAGDADVSSEFIGAKRVGITEIEGEDIKVIGEVYDIIEEGETETDRELSKPFEDRDRTGRNQVEVYIHRDTSPTIKEISSQEDAVQKVRRVPIKARYAIKQGGISKDSALYTDWSIDYKDSQGVRAEEGRPHIEEYNVYVWNGGTTYYKAGTQEVDEMNKDAEIGIINYKGVMPEEFRLKEMKIPEEVFNGLDWYVKKLEIEDEGGRKVDVRGEFEKKGSYYVLDIHKLYKKGVLNLPVVGEDTDFIELKIKSYEIEIETKHPTDLSKHLLPLADESDPRKYIAGKDTPIVTYSGQWLDKQKKDWDNDVWTEGNSKPTIQTDMFRYAPIVLTHSMEGVRIGAIQKGTTIDSDYPQTRYRFMTSVYNRIANVSIEETKEDNNVLSFGTYKEGGVEKPTNYYSILDGDRIEYNWVIKAEDKVRLGKTDSGYGTDDEIGAISFKNPKFRYNAPEGMRVVSWKYKDIDSGIDKGVIKGELIGDTGVRVGVKEGEEINGNEKVLEISIADTLEVGESIEIEIELEVEDEVGIEDEDNRLSAPNTQRYTQIGNLEIVGGEKYGHRPYTFTKGSGERTQNGTYNTVNLVEIPSVNEVMKEDGKKEGVYRTEGLDIGGENTGWGRGKVSSQVTYHLSEPVDLKFDWKPPQEVPNPENVDGYDIDLTVSNIINETLHPLESKEIILDFKYNENVGSGGYNKFKIKQSFYLRDWVDFSKVDRALVRDVELYYLTDDKHPLTTGLDVEPKWEKVTSSTPNPEEFTEKGNPVSAIKIVYKGVKATDNGNKVDLGELVVEGIGRYTDDRLESDIENGVNAKNTSKVIVKGKVNNNYELEGKIRQIRANSETSIVVQRAKPVLFVDTKPYDSGGNVKTTYRPGDEVWYKSVVENIYEKATGALHNPVVYDKVPEYIDYPKLEDMEIVMKDRGGNIVKTYNVVPSNVAQGDNDVRVTTEDIRGLDIGGNQALNRTEEGRTFKDTKPTEGGQRAEEIEFRMYRFEFPNDLDRGYSFEIKYKSRVKKVGELREGLTHPITKWKDNGEEIPAHIPRIGEYNKFSTNSYMYDHLRNPIEDRDNTRGNVRDTVMDMSNIYHEVGASGDLPNGVDRWEFLDTSEIEINGYKDKGSSDNWYYDDNTDVVFDTDIKTGMRERGEIRTVKEKGNKEVSGLYKTNLDLYKYLLSGRVKREDLGSLIGTENIIWSMSGIHLLTGWLYTASSFETENGGTRDENGVGNSVNIWTKVGTDPNNSNNRYMWVDEDESIVGLEYSEEFVTNLYGINYGDWALDGVEFIYTMPSGVEPIIQTTTGGTVTTGSTVEKLGIKAEYVEGINLDDSAKGKEGLKNGLDMNGHTTKYDIVKEIPKDLIEVEILQSPENNKGLKAPKEYQEGRNVKNNSKNNYYRDEVPYVLKITVKSELGKWFNRGTKENYRIRVSIPSRVYKENANGMWYDEVYARPYDANEKAEIKNSDCYQIYNVTQWSGDTETEETRDLQGYGMERRLVHTSMYSYYEDLNFYSPNTEYVNGYNVQASRVLEDKYEGEDVLYAKNGTRAIKKKGFMRMWLETGERDNTTDILKKENFYYDAELGDEELKVVIDNRYVRAMNPNTRNELAFSNYDIDGGYKGSIIEPVYRIILPKGIVPVYENGMPIVLKEGEKREQVEGVKFNIELKEWETNRELKDKTTEELNNEFRSKYEVSIERHREGLIKNEVSGRYEVIIKPKAKDYEKVAGEVIKVKSEELMVLKLGVLLNESVEEELVAKAYVESNIKGQEIVTDNDVLNNNKEDVIGGDPRKPVTHRTRDYRTGLPLNQDEEYKGTSRPIPIRDNKADYRIDAQMTSNNSQASGRVELDGDNSTRFIGLMGTYNVKGKEMRGGVNEVKLREAKPLLKPTKKLLEGLEGDVFKYNEDVWYDIEILNDNSLVEHESSVKHSKIEIIDYIPNPLKWEGEVLIEYKKETGGIELLTLEDAEAKGWEVKTELVEETEGSSSILGHKGASVLRIEVVTPKEEGSKGQEEIYTQGKLPEGNLRPGESFKVWVKTRVGELQGNEDMKIEDEWRDNFYNTVYVNLIERDGGYIEGEKFDKEDILRYVNKTSEEELNVDINLDGDKTDEYSTTKSKEIGVLNPRVGVRLDTLNRNIYSYDPISEIETYDYAKFKTVGDIDMLITEARLKEGQASELVIQYDIPYRGTDYMKEPVKPSHPEIETYVKEIRTGVWEVPKGVVNWRLLEERLKLYVYYLERDDDKYTHIKDEDDKEKNWVLLNEDKNGDGIAEGIGLKANEVLKIPEGADNIRQLRIVVKDEEGELLIPQGFRLDVDANLSTEGKEELDEIDPNRMHVEDIYKGGNVLDNSIRVMLRHVNTGTREIDNKITIVGNGRKYVETNVSLDVKYDDTQYSDGLGKTSTGYILTPENPAMWLDYEARYLRGELINKGTEDQPKYEVEYKWTNNLLMNSNSYMLKEQLLLSNVPEEISNHKSDILTNPSLALALPKVMKNPKGKFKYVPYKDITKEHILSEDYVSDKAYGINQDLYWTWFVVNREGKIVEKPKVEYVPADSKGQPHVYTNYVDYTQEKRVIKWDFKGVLNPGETIIVTTLLEVEELLGGAYTNEDVRFRYYGLKSSTFTPYIVKDEDEENEVALFVDSVDIDKDTDAYEQTLMLRNESLRFESYDNFIRNKRVMTESDVTGTLSGEPLKIREGGVFRFSNKIQNTASESLGYRLPVQLDILPREEDKYIIGRYVDADNVTEAPRESKWAGKIDLDSFELKKVQGGKETEVPKNEYEIWLGPIKEEGYPDIKYRSKTWFFEDMEGMPRMDGTDNEKGKEDYFVRLEDFKSYLQGVDSEYKREKLLRGVNMFYVRFKNVYKEFEGESAYVLNYNMKAPLNLPFVAGEGVDSEKRYEKTVMWNTFGTWAKRLGMSPTESNRSGVYINADEGRGYIGDYIWLDLNGNGDYKDEGEYGKVEKETLRDVRLGGVEGEDINKDGEVGTKDINGDGVIDKIGDDAGINGVKVELLTKNGYISDKEGNAVIKEGNKYKIINEETGDYMKEGGIFRYGREPRQMETEYDYYMNKGYYMLTDIKPGEYKLRFTFPEEYNDYMVSTGKINGVGYKVYRKGDRLPDLKGNIGAEGDNEVVKSLTIETDVIVVEGLKAGSEEEVKEYDKKATGYDIGITLPVSYGGQVWLDREEIVGGTTTSSTVVAENRGYSRSNGTGNGVIDKGEPLLENVKVKLYEVVEEEGVEVIKEGIGLDNKPLEVLTNEKGEYQFESIRPERDYIVRIVGGVNTILDTPVYEADVFKADHDNNVKKVGGVLETEKFKASIPRDKDGKFIYKGGTKKEFVENTLIDLGLIDELGAVGDRVWLDQNNNGLQEEGEKGIEGIKLSIEGYYVDKNGELVSTGYERSVETNQEGYYLFRGLSSFYRDEHGEDYLQVYKIRIDNLDITKYKVSPSNKGGVESLDNDLEQGSKYLHGEEGYVTVAKEIIEEGGVNKEHIRYYKGKKYDISERVSDYTNDAGLTPYKIGGYVWRDKNKDGIRQETESLLEGLSVRLYKEKVIVPTTGDTTTGGTTTGGTVIVGAKEGESKGLLYNIVSYVVEVVEKVLNIGRALVDEFVEIKEEKIEKIEGEYEYIGETVTDSEGFYSFYEDIASVRYDEVEGKYKEVRYIVEVVDVGTDKKITKYKKGLDTRVDSDFRRLEKGTELISGGGIVATDVTLVEVLEGGKLDIKDISDIDLGLVFRADTIVVEIPEEKPPIEEPSEPEIEEDEEDNVGMRPSIPDKPDNIGDGKPPVEEGGEGDKLPIEETTPPTVIPEKPTIDEGITTPPTVVPSIPPTGGDIKPPTVVPGKPQTSGNGDEGLQTSDDLLGYIYIFVLSSVVFAVTTKELRKRKRK